MPDEAVDKEALGISDESKHLGVSFWRSSSLQRWRKADADADAAEKRDATNQLLSNCLSFLP